jgi:hypothetical protein
MGLESEFFGRPWAEEQAQLVWEEAAEEPEQLVLVETQLKFCVGVDDNKPEEQFVWQE